MNSHRVALCGLTALALLVPSAAVAATPDSPPASQLSASSKKQQKQALIAFNGFYSLAGTTNGFFAVDTNMQVSGKNNKTTYDVSLIVSLDGKTSEKATYKGTFDGRHLKQSTSGGPSFDLTFKRKPHTLGPTATVSGKVTLPGQSPVSISGTTYNNPIPPTFWGGRKYYLTPVKAGTAPVLVGRISKDGTLYYDNGSGDGKLTRVKSYKYNMDMYYFTFDGGGSKQATFIMGTAGQSGFAINNMVIENSQPVSQRNLLTIPKAQPPKKSNYYPEFHLAYDEPANISIGADTTLADLSAYYPITSAKNSNAFVSIQGKNLNLVPGIEETVPGSSPGQLYQALITVSWNGKKVKSWYFDVSKGMTFDGETLRMPKQGIKLTLKRQYDKKTRALFSMSGKIKGKKVQGSSLFNTVPVGAFAGSMKDNSGQHTMTVDAGGAVTVDGTAIGNYEYVPTMYILAGPVPGTTKPMQPVTLISFGHAGASGMSAIVTTDFGTPAAKVFNVYQVPPTP